MRVAEVPGGVGDVAWKVIATKKRRRAMAVAGIGMACLIVIAAVALFAPKGGYALTLREVQDATLKAHSVRWLNHWHARLIKFEKGSPLLDKPVDSTEENVFVANPPAHYVRDVGKGGPWMRTTTFPFKLPVKGKRGTYYVDSFGTRRVPLSSPATLRLPKGVIGSISLLGLVGLSEFESSTMYLNHLPAIQTQFEGKHALQVLIEGDGDGYHSRQVIVVEKSSKRLLLWELRVSLPNGEEVALHRIGDIRYDVAAPKG